jgi:hypothetical protein
MNRTLVHASLHVKDALRPRIQLSTCWSCAVTRTQSQRVQYHILRRTTTTTTESLSRFGNAVRLLNTKRAKYSKEPKLLSHKKERFKQYPSLEGERPSSISRPFSEVQTEQRQQRYKERVSTEEKRISSIQNKPPKTKSDSETPVEKKRTTSRSARSSPSPEHKGVYSPSNFPL